MTIMDAETLRSVARLARMRAKRGTAASDEDGLVRLGAQRALVQLAKDLEATADHAGSGGNGEGR